MTEYAVEIGVAKSSIYEWVSAHEEFSDAFARAQEVGQAYWEKKLRTELMLNRDANAPLVKLYFANRFNWHDKQEIEQTNTHRFAISDEPEQGTDEWLSSNKPK